jgi:serine/threonine protein kinase
MSPEQARGEPADRRTDVWAFGCVLFEMLSGSRTFAGKTTSDVLASALKAEPDWKKLPANLHPRILHLLERYLEKDPQDRSQGLADARFEIKKAMKDADGGLSRQPAQSRSGLRSRFLWIAAIVLAAVLGPILGWVFKPVEPGRVAKLQLVLPEGHSLTDYVPAMAISRDGSRKNEKTHLDLDSGYRVLTFSR